MAFQNEDDRKYRITTSREKLTFTATETATSINLSKRLNGKMLQYIIVAPNLATDTTFDITVTNEDDVKIYENTGLADNGTVVTLVSDKPIPLSGIFKYTISYTTSQVSEFTMYIYYE